MTQNLQIAGEPDQWTANSVSESVQDARSLIDHLNSAVEASAAEISEGGLPAIEQSMREASSFAKAILRQADQIQYLVEQVNRLDSDAEVEKLREVVIDLHHTLTDITLQTKQSSSEIAARVGLLVEALAIIGGAPGNIEAADNATSVLAGAKAAAERLASLERLSTRAGGSIIALEDRSARDQQKIHDLSLGLIKLDENIESGRKEIAELQQRIGSTDEAIAQGLAALGGDIQAHRTEISGLHQRIGSADQAIAHGLATLGGDIQAHRTEISGLHQRIGSADQATARELAALTGNIDADRKEIAGLHQRIGSVDQAIAQGFVALGGNIEADRKEIAGLHQRIGSSDEALARGLATLDGRTSALHDDLVRIGERLISVETGTVTHNALKETVQVLSRRLEGLEQNAAAEIQNWKLQEAERNVALTSKLGILEQQNRILSLGAEQMATRLNAAEQTITTMIQRQKAQSALHDRVAQMLLANPETPV